MRFLPRILTRNWFLKAAALGLAVLLWLLLRVEDANRQEISDVPVEVELLDPAWALSGSPLPSTVQVRFSGPSRELLRMALERPAAVVPIERVAAEDTTVAIRNDWVRIQERSGVVVEDVSPRNVRISFEPMERVAVPVAPRTAGTLRENLAFSGEPAPTPSEVSVSGPRSRVQALDTLELAPVLLAGLEGPASRRVPVDTTGLGGLNVTPDEITVILPVEERVERSLGALAVEVVPEERAAGLEVEPDSVAVSASGPRSAMAGLAVDDLRVTVDVEGADGLTEAQEGVTLSLAVLGVPEYVETSLEADSVTVRPEAEDG